MVGRSMATSIAAASGRVAIVTGAGSGVGRAAALALLGDGYRVALAGRRAEALEATAALARGAGRSLLVPTDVRRPDQVAALFARTRDTWGRVDVLFNNAGVGGPPVPFEDVPFDAWQAVLDVNVTGMFLCMQEAFRVMKAQDPRGGRIINNGSISAQVPRPDSAPYTASKHAVAGLTRAAALDGRKYDIAVGQLDIGNAATEMNQRMLTGVPQANGTIAAEPRMDVDHVGRAVLMMANLPLDANVLFMTILATKMPFVGRG